MAVDVVLRPLGPSRVQCDPSASERVRAVVAAFNTWAFKREQPSDAAALAQAVTAAIAARKPVPFVLYWGKGPRQTVEGPERSCMEFLARFGARVRSAYAGGADICLICTDTHARLNGHSEESINRYFGALDDLAGAHGFRTQRLGAIVEAFGGRDCAMTSAEPDVLAALEKCAAKWYRGEGASADGARRYFRLNMTEKQAVAAAHPGSIFITFNGSEFRSLFPDTLPIFYMYSLRRGVSVKPWFIDATSGQDRMEGLAAAVPALHRSDATR
jgi:hypothetical protein